MLDDFYRHMDEIDKRHKNMEDEFRRLCAEPSCKIPEVGDRVIVAIGFLGMGFIWVREEAVVVEKGDTSYKVRCSRRKDILTGKPDEFWVHQALITDVLGK